MSRRRRPRWVLGAVAAYAFLVPLQPVFTMPDGSPLRFAAADLAAPLVFLAGIARPRRRLPLELTALALAIPLLALFATLWAGLERPLSYYALGKTGGLCYLVGVALCAARALGPGDGRTVLRALAAGGVASAAVGLVAFAAALRGVDTPLVSTGRLCSTMLGDPNIYCSLLAVSLLVVVYEPGLRAAVRIPAIGVLVLAVLATGSRSGLVGTVAGLAVCELLRSRDPWAGILRAAYGAAAAATGVGALLMTDAGWRVALTLWDHIWRTWTVESRFELYARAAQQFADHPLLGLGIGGFNELNSWDLSGHGEHFAVHNTYLWALVDLGLGGGLLVVALIGAAVVWSGRVARRPPGSPAAAIVAAGIVTLAMFNLFVDGFYQRHFWVFFACALALPAVRRRARRAVVVGGARVPRLGWTGST